MMGPSRGKHAVSNSPKLIAGVCLLSLVACSHERTSSDVQRDRQERLIAEAAAQVGMPAIKNFRELKMVKDIYELRDQTGLVTYTYLVNDRSGRLIFFCDSIGYGVPYATQFSAPTSIQRYHLAGRSNETDTVGTAELPQAEPNGLFVPQAAEGTWVMCKNPEATESDVRPVYLEPRIIVSQFKLPCRLLEEGCQSPTEPAAAVPSAVAVPARAAPTPSAAPAR
jgi:hypothetical protein